jgi:hypothetical protein
LYTPFEEPAAASNVATITIGLSLIVVLDVMVKVLQVVIH